MKARIVEHLGQSAIILPALVREGLAANDRAKVRMASQIKSIRESYFAGDGKTTQGHWAD